MQEEEEEEKERTQCNLRDENNRMGSQFIALFTAHSLRESSLTVNQA